MIFQLAEKYTQDLHYTINKDWVVHNKPSMYMDRDGRMKEMMHLKTVCGENKLNIQILFYDGHVSNFDERDIDIPLYHNIKPFFLKARDSGNDQPNDNGPNLNLKGLYGQARMNWQRKHVTLKPTNDHMNYVLVETCRYFQLSSAPITINDFNKTKLVPLTPTDEDTNTQTCLAESQTTKGKKM